MSVAKRVSEDRARFGSHRAYSGGFALALDDLPAPVGRQLSMGTVVSAIVGVELSLVDGFAFGRGSADFAIFVALCWWAAAAFGRRRDEGFGAKVLGHEVGMLT
jgi:hypothetical protein